jgi:hypothetical protein
VFPELIDEEAAGINHEDGSGETVPGIRKTGR